MLLLDGKPACAILASDRELTMKRLAAALGGKSAAMMTAAQAERVSGYKVGGVSTFGQPRRVPEAIDADAQVGRGTYRARVGQDMSTWGDAGTKPKTKREDTTSKTT